jgi:hypothetical protein
MRLRVNESQLWLMLMQIDGVTATMAKEEIKMRQRRDAK